MNLCLRCFLFLYFLKVDLCIIMLNFYAVTHKHNKVKPTCSFWNFWQGLGASEKLPKVLWKKGGHGNQTTHVENLVQYAS